MGLNKEKYMIDLNLVRKFCIPIAYGFRVYDSKNLNPFQWESKQLVVFLIHLGLAFILIEVADVILFVKNKIKN